MYELQSSMPPTRSHLQYELPPPPHCRVRCVSCFWFDVKYARPGLCFRHSTPPFPGMCAQSTPPGLSVIIHVCLLLVAVGEPMASARVSETRPGLLSSAWVRACAHKRGYNFPLAVSLVRLLVLLLSTNSSSLYLHVPVYCVFSLR